MRFLTALSVGLLASQARVASALKAYTLDSTLTCSSGPDTVHFDFSLSGLDTPPNFPGTDIYEVAYRVVYTAGGLVSSPVTVVSARDGTGRSEIQNNQFATTNKDNGGAAAVGQTVYQLPGTILHHQQVNGVGAVAGFFEIDNVSASIATPPIVCYANNTANIKLVPQQYAINGINQLVVNSYDVISSTAYQQVVATTPSANPIYSFDVTPGLNIDSCFNDKDPITGAPRIRVPFRVSNLAVPGITEKGIVSLVVSDDQGNAVSAWTLNADGMQIGQGFRDAAAPEIVNWVQSAGQGQVFGRLDFDANTPNVTCSDAGLTNILLSVVDYSTIDTSTGVQTWHFIPGAVNNGINGADAQARATPAQLVVQAAGATAAPTQPPNAQQKAARQAAAKAACQAAAQKKAAAAAQAAAAAAAGQDAAHPCLLTVPANPLTAQGLATPYILGGLCTMAATASFVQATIISPATGKVFAYQPLVVQQGKKALINPVVPTLPADAVVGLWFGSNANVQQLVAPAAAPNTLKQANCVNGVMINGAMSLFGQIAACNGANFYSAAAMAVFNGLLTVPPLGTAIDGKPCPTLRSFDVVDQDQQDNLQTQYLLDANGNTALNSPANLAQLTAAATAAKQAPPTVLGNPGDNPLLSRFINPALKCNSWMIPDLSIPGTMSVTAPIGEILAAFKQGSPVARCPAGHAMALDGNGNPNLNKLNALRVALAGQNAVQSLNQASTISYCKNMVGPNGAVRVLNNMKIFANVAGPVAGQNLFQFLQTRFAAAVGPANLMCGKLVPGLTNPLAGGAVIAAQDAFKVQDALLAGAAAGDNQAQDPFAELSGGQISGAAPASGNTFPVAIVAGAVGGVVALIIASVVIFKVVQKRKQTSNVMNTTARECKV